MSEKPNRSNVISKALFERFFYDKYRSLVVLSNPKTILNSKYAKKEVKEQVIRADQLVEYIRRADSDAKAVATSEKDMESLAQFFLNFYISKAMKGIGIKLGTYSINLSEDIIDGIKAKDWPKLSNWLAYILSLAVIEW